MKPAILNITNPAKILVRQFPTQTNRASLKSSKRTIKFYVPGKLPLAS
jgi:hypothetical protein